MTIRSESALQKQATQESLESGECFREATQISFNEHDLLFLQPSFGGLNDWVWNIDVSDKQWKVRAFTSWKVTCQPWHKREKNPCRLIKEDFIDFLAS